LVKRLSGASPPASLPPAEFIPRLASMRTHTMLRRSCAFSLAVLLLAVTAVSAKEEGFREALFSGKNLDGWIVTGCDVAVEDGALLLKSGDGLVRSAYNYRDFGLEVDAKNLKPTDYDSGIYIRGELPKKGPFPKRYQVNLKQGFEGNLAGVKDAVSSGLYKPGEWNHLKITVIGKTAQLEMNGKPAWKTDALEVPTGFVGFQSEVKLGGQFLFRNFTITELGFKPLFNGKDLSGWQGGTNGYSVENGILVSHKHGSGDLFTDKEYSDFAVRFEFKLEPGANNGLGVHAPLTGDKTVAYRGIEIQILDDTDKQYKDLHPYQAHGSVYGVVAAEKGHLNPVGQWNYQEVISQGKHITVILNGVTIVDADVEKASTPATIDGQDHPGLKRTTGYVGFLGHGARIEFRNIRLEDLSKP
jgi:hypothetical protein